MVITPPLDEGVVYIMLRIHMDLFADFPGKLFVGLMGIMFVMDIISGVVVYGQIMKKYDFEMIREQKIKAFEMAGYLDITFLTWILIIGIMGIINALSDVALGLWQQGQLAEITASYRNAKPLDHNSFSQTGFFGFP